MPISALLDWAPAFILVLARVAAAMMFLPGLGETGALSTLRIGLALGLTILLLPVVKPGMPAVPEAGLGFGLMVIAEVVTGCWFGWLSRQTALILPMMGQMAAYLIGLASVLQPDPELGSQTTAFSKMFEVAMPVLVLATGLYRLPLLALAGLFQLVPPGQILPAGDGLQSVMVFVSGAFSLAVQLATPFIVVSLMWHVTMGLVSRLVSRMQIYFISMPGQLLAGLFALLLTVGSAIVGWRAGAELLLVRLPGG